MSQTSKLFLVGMLCFIFGAAGVFAWSRYSLTQSENTKLKAELGASSQPSPELPKVASPTPGVEKLVAATTGSISGVGWLPV